MYIGKNAGRRYAETEAFEAATPPDLEVEVTKFDDGKPSRYAELRVLEMRRVASRDFGYRVEILDKRSPGGPRPAEECAALPDLRTQEVVDRGAKRAVSLRFGSSRSARPSPASRKQAMARL
ncbi:MAG: hypothetical protein OXI01_02005 [Albidovulum sp.]|nr:hypothetical protein [Albidovulum sp.]